MPNRDPLARAARAAWVSGGTRRLAVWGLMGMKPPLAVMTSRLRQSPKASSITPDRRRLNQQKTRNKRERKDQPGGRQFIRKAGTDGRQVSDQHLGEEGKDRQPGLAQGGDHPLAALKAGE